MALFKKMLKKETKENVLKPGENSTNTQSQNINELDLNNIASLSDENLDQPQNLPSLDLPDFDSLLDESKEVEKKESPDLIRETKKEEKINSQNLENEKTPTNTTEKKVDNSELNLSSATINDSVNVYDGDYFVSLNNYKSVCDRLDNFDTNVKDFNKISDEFFSLYNGKDTLLKNSDNSFEEIHRKILLIDGICFKDD